MKSFLIRLGSSIVILAVTLTLVILGGTPLWIALGIFSLMGQWELYRVVGIEKGPLGIAAYLAGIALDVLLFFQGMEYFPIFLGAVLIVLLSIYVLTFPKYQIEQCAMAVFGILYVTLLFSYIYQVRMVSGGAYLVWLIFIGSWGSDTCAYLVGILIGKHRLPGRMKDLSPKKSIEGCLGGVLGAGLLGFIYGSIFSEQMSILSNPAIGCLLLGSASSVISQLGDWAASAIKRNHNVKDYSHLIPGHGGILDRFDAVLFTGPVVYYLIIIGIL